MRDDAAAAHPPSPEPPCALCGGNETACLFTKAGWRFVRCAACGLVSLRPLPTPTEVEEHHEAAYRDGGYAVFAAAEEVRTTIARHRLDLVRPLAPPGPWLDVGCSTGTFVAEAAAAGIAAEGLELSSVAVAQARARGVTVHQGTAERFVPPRRYAVVTAFDVVEHLREPRAFIDRVSSWLLPDGVLALTLPDASSPTARLMGPRWFYYAPPDHIHYFTPATIRRLLASSGLGGVAVRRVRKPLTLDYAAGQLATMAPGLAPAARALARVLPPRWRARPVPIPLGEMLVTARPERRS